MPSAGWTNGDAPAQERNVGPLNRGAYLARLVAAGRRGAELRGAEGGRPRGRARPRSSGRCWTRSCARPQAVASGPGRIVLDTIVAWDGNYDREDANGTVDPGVVAFDALKDAAEARLPAGGGHVGSASAAGRTRTTSAAPRRRC